MDGEVDGQAQGLSAAVSANVRMRAAREQAGLSLPEVAQRTRVPLRHLEALERGDYGALPGVTYCSGFTRAYARAVGLDEKALVAQVREEVENSGDFASPDQYQIEEPTDPARVPPRIFAWVTAIIAVLLAGGYALWRMQINTPPETELAAPAEQPKASPAARPVQPPVTGPVVLTAAEDVWLRIYDADGKSLYEKMMKKGESYTVPADANNPMILTGRPDALAVTVGGRAVPPLGTAERTISDVPISAQALLARGMAAPTATPGNGEMPANAMAPANGATQAGAGATGAAATATAAVARPGATNRPAAATATAPVRAQGSGQGRQTARAASRSTPRAATPAAQPAPAAEKPAAVEGSAPAPAASPAQ